MKIVKIQDTGVIHVPKEFRDQIGDVDYMKVSMSGNTMVCQPVTG